MEEIETISTARWRLEITLRFDESPIHFNIRSMVATVPQNLKQALK